MMSAIKPIWNRMPKVYRYMLGGLVLTINAGFINVLALLSSFAQPVSHLTGITSNLGIALVENPAQVLPLLLTILFFVAGSAISGLIIDSTQLRFGRRYGFILMFEGVVLATAVPFLTRDQRAGIYLLSLACGLQNGMVTTYSGAIVRTTHITGLLTDLGIYLGKWLLGRERDAWRWQMYVVLFVGFLLGGVFGTFLFAQMGLLALYFCALLIGLLGFGYWLWRHLLGREQAKFTMV